MKSFKMFNIEGARISLMQKFNWKRYGIHNTVFGGDYEVWIDHSITTLQAGSVYTAICSNTLLEQKRCTPVSRFTMNHQK